MRTQNIWRQILTCVYADQAISLQFVFSNITNSILFKMPIYAWSNPVATEVRSPKLNWPEREADHSPLSNTEVNVWS
jgi:hypothetical protein